MGWSESGIPFGLPSGETELEIEASGPQIRLAKLDKESRFFPKATALAFASHRFDWSQDIIAAKARTPALSIYGELQA